MSEKKYEVTVYYCEDYKSYSEIVEANNEEEAYNMVSPPGYEINLGRDIEEIIDND